MTEIAQLFESTLRQNRSRAAMNTVARMPASTTLRELLDSDAADAIRALSLAELAQALREGGRHESGANGSAAGVERRRRTVTAADQSPQERLYLQILEAIADEALTIGQLSKRLDLDVEELRGYLNWMKKVGKVVSSGRARATRYQVAP
jgi:predicted Rossmann fold nucleotide-binding protein DprA/Smf involved in DNA uptake